jgi:hypothetical protein
VECSADTRAMPKYLSKLPSMSQRISDLTKLCTSTTTSTFLLDEVCPERSSHCTCVCPSLKWWNHSKTCLRVMAPSQKVLQ